MKAWDLSALGRVMATSLVIGIGAAIVVLAWFGYRATREWRRSSDMLEQRRTDQAADLIERALARDMRGVQTLVLPGLHWDQITLDAPHDLSDMVASAFARYPYPEAFFGWNGRGDAASALFFTRADRRPAWLPLDGAPSRFPVTLVRQEAAARVLMEQVAAGAAHGQRFAVFETEIEGEPYQVVARLMYRTSRRSEVERVFGFVVNLRWVRSSYFSELIDVAGRIAAAESGLTMAILDERGALVAGEMPGRTDDRLATVRRIRPWFFEPSLVAVDPADALPHHFWTLRVSAAADASRAFALRGSDRTIVVTSTAVAVLGFGLLLTARALRASADLAKLRSDFVASVTHELKTPLSTIRVVGETLSRGRVTDAGEIREYAQLLDGEAKRLTRLVDNLLAYSRVTDVSEVYSFEPLAPADLLDDILHGFQPQFSNRGFDVNVEIPPDLPAVRGDRTALGLVLDNVVDNAMRYSGESRWLGVNARHDGREVHIDVTDRGVGIPPDELETVVRRFVRGRHTGLRGSGLGLAIASRVMKDHGGQMRIESRLGTGTTVRMSLPVVEGAQ